ncbi:MAG: hypothetical protein Q4E64_02740 [Phascolarctobacterium sp.]|uniref:hypothetical protein n=1 Tax=Phascolarctobacterium sp. TaxID=2049039 RepID=UPI0026DD8E4B|nr:hypothetical protein [Phascolarctobacterium sp.]MDO4920731.1 hypothetical protein [Phascolarctobacterium sp.]
MEGNKEFIANAKNEQLTEKEMEAVAGGGSIECSGVKRAGLGGSYSTDTFMLNKMKKELEDSNLKKVENLLRSGEW